MTAPDGAPPDIRDRALDYALRAVRLHQHLQQLGDRAGWVIADQYLRAATSLGANLEEAQAAETRADFVHKCSIAQKEAREGVYWLRLLERSGLVTPESLAALQQEAHELLAIVSAIVVRAKANAG